MEALLNYLGIFVLIIVLFMVTIVAAKECSERKKTGNQGCHLNERE